VRVGGGVGHADWRGLGTRVRHGIGRIERRSGGPGGEPSGAGPARRRAQHHFFRRDPLRELDERREGTLPPERRASLRPMAMACFRLVTFFPERPDLSSPRFISCIARSTFCPDFAP
jgi:hypothetical protein